MAKKYTKTMARRACKLCKGKLSKLYDGGYISADQFVKLSKQFDMINKKVV